jgi:hypothetical protein
MEGEEDFAFVSGGDSGKLRTADRKLCVNMENEYVGGWWSSHISPGGFVFSRTASIVA